MLISWGCLPGWARTWQDPVNEEELGDYSEAETVGGPWETEWTPTGGGPFPVLAKQQLLV